MSEPSRDLLVATSNPGKVKEIRNILGDLNLTITSLSGDTIAPPEETGSSYAENAMIKAIAYAKHADTFILADDSGLEVDYLSGAPGLHSARFAEGSDENRVNLLLHKLAGVADQDRSARFVSVCVIVDPAGQVLHISEGRCEGRIGHQPFGNNGFGYDPVFIPDGYELTFAQLPSEIKNKISHRAKALVLIREYLNRVFVAA